MNSGAPRIIIEDFDHATDAALSHLLESANDVAGFRRNRRDFSAALRDDDGTLQGGVKAQAFWGWLYIAELAVAPQWRGRGYGRTLLTLAEEFGTASGCDNAWLMTMRFQAKRFYESAGYVPFATLPHYPSEESRCFLRKTLPR